MVHFSGFARKMNHLSYFCASEASAKVPFNAYFEFMYGFKNSNTASRARFARAREGNVVHFSGFARKMNHLSSFCASEASAKGHFKAYFGFMYGFKSILSISQ
ncbi:MAG: hypothetical protein U5L45_11255 [Saprospiraceae bacterium]|nr:hypothetical protein [Saprospiraceae bacterium]